MCLEEGDIIASYSCYLLLYLQLSSGKLPRTSKASPKTGFSHCVVLFISHGKIPWAFFLQFPVLPICWSTLFVPNQLLIISFAVPLLAVFQVTPTRSKNVPELSILYQLLETNRLFSQAVHTVLCALVFLRNKFTGQTGLSPIFF